MEEWYKLALLEQWRTYAQEQQKEKGAKFWQEYFKQETEFYKTILLLLLLGIGAPLLQ